MAAPEMRKPVLVTGMHGLGDNVRQRAIVRALIAQGWDVWLKTPWPCLYHDLVGDQLHLLKPDRTLRTQHKNSTREIDSYSFELPPRSASLLRVWYDHANVRAAGCFMGGMMLTTLRRNVAGADFSLPVPAQWRAKAAARIARPDRPIMVLRPLVVRDEWKGCEQRNPDPDAYAALYNAIRARFFVVSVADLVWPIERTVGPKLDADVTLHAGELDTEAMAGLMASAAVTFCSPGFAIALSQAVGTPVICVFGGHESSRLYRYGDRFAPTLTIDPIRPCECFSKTHKCDKRIDLDAAHANVARFISTNVAPDHSRVPA
jgi:hypothetical protein